MFIKGAVFGSVTAISLWALNIFANSSDIFTKLEAAEVIEPSDNDDISMDDISKIYGWYTDDLSMPYIVR